jgi:hypothetical protein
MFTRDKQDRIGKAAANDVPGRGDSSAEVYPVWESLALHPASIQTKLTVSAPNDIYELKADRVAESVMRTDQPARADPPSALGASVTVQRMCNECEEEEH